MSEIRRQKETKENAIGNVLFAVYAQEVPLWANYLIPKVILF